MGLRLITCACGHPAMRPTGEINRAERRGWPLWCSQACAGLARRIERTDEERRQIKAAYDAQRRVELADEIRAKKRAYHLRTYDPAKAAEERQKRMPRHVEYCRRPEYRKWKADYDRKHLAAKQYGPFAEAALILRDIETEVLSRIDRTEIARQNGTLNKKQSRRRDYDQAVGS